MRALTFSSASSSAQSAREQIDLMSPRPDALARGLIGDETSLMTDPHSRLPARTGAGSAVARLLLIGVATFTLVNMPENIRTWHKPAARVLPSERNMPFWGNHVFMAVLLAAIIALALGWVLRRRRARGLAGVVATVWMATSWFSIIGLCLWAAVLTVSQVIALSPQYGVTGLYGMGIILDGVFAMIAVLTLVVLVRDVLALRRSEN